MKEGRKGAKESDENEEDRKANRCSFILYNTMQYNILLYCISTFDDLDRT
jgi:hypothetical protein